MQGYYKTHCQPPFKKFTLKIQLKKKRIIYSSVAAEGKKGKGREASRRDKIKNK